MTKIILTILFFINNPSNGGYLILEGFKSQQECIDFTISHKEMIPGFVLGYFKYPPDLKLTVTDTKCEVAGTDL